MVKRREFLAHLAATPVLISSLPWEPNGEHVSLDSEIGTQRKPLLHIRGEKQLLLDDEVIDQTVNCQRQFHRPVRYPGSPLIEADRPWEQGGAGTYLFGGTVLFDEEAKIFKMWYRTDKIVKLPHGGYEIPEGGYSACYAVSKDGLNWEKPVLGLVDYEGSTQNNILPRGAGEKAYVRRPNLIKDYEELDPEKRYKMVYLDEVKGEFVLAKAYSRDGIYWRMNVGRPVLFEKPLIPNGELFGWDPKLRQYMLFHRKSGSIMADVDGRKVRTEHAFVLSTSPDFESWGNTREIIKRNEKVDPPRWDPSHVGVITAILYTEKQYIGFLDTCMTHYVEDVPENLWSVYSTEHAEHKTELITSRDGNNWTRLAPHWPFIRPGLWGTWDRDHVALAKPIVRNDEILIYYTGNNLPCKAQIPGHPQNALIDRVIDGQRMGYAIGLAKLRLDGFASMEGYDPEGTIITRPLMFEGDHLVINARAPTKPFSGVAMSDPQRGGEIKVKSVSGPFGTLRVEILDARGIPLEGFRAADCDAFAGDEIRHVVTWNGKKDVSNLVGKQIRLKFRLANAGLYSFQFTGKHLKPSQINSLCPGCRGRPSMSDKL